MAIVSSIDNSMIQDNNKLESNGIEKEHKNQVLLGITGSGKTFSMANVVQQLQRPALVIAHNKTLAAQLYNEFQSFFPENLSLIHI